MALRNTVVLLFCLVLVCKSGGNAVDVAGKLEEVEQLSPEELAELMQRYEWDVRTIYSTRHGNPLLRDLPPQGDQGQISVKMKLYVQRIDELDLEHGVLDSLCILKLSWRDARWDWTGKHSIPRLILPREAVWKPDIILFNNDAQKGHKTMIDEDIRVTVDMDGTVTFYEPLHVHSTCANLTSTYANGDNVTCSLMFGSWVFPSRRVLPVKDGDGVENHTQLDENKHWRLLSVSAEVEHRDYDGIDYADMKYTLQLQHHD